MLFNRVKIEVGEGEKDVFGETHEEEIEKAEREAEAVVAPVVLEWDPCWRKMKGLETLGCLDSGLCTLH